MTYKGYTKYLWGGRRSFLMPLLGLLVAGCGSQGTISGKVLYQGKPLPGGTVTFFTADKGAMSSVITPEGNYTVSKVPSGEVKIAVQSLRPKRGRSSFAKQMMEKAMRAGKVGQEKVPSEVKEDFKPSDPEASGQPVQIPPHYADPEKSGLTYTVTGGKQTYDIELK